MVILDREASLLEDIYVQEKNRNARRLVSTKGEKKRKKERKKERAECKVTLSEIDMLEDCFLFFPWRAHAHG